MPLSFVWRCDFLFLFYSTEKNAVVFDPGNCDQKNTQADVDLEGQFNRSY